ncbi:MAG: heavy metal translocating P-type ATPase [Planctomycetes bacterium]|nr:heavy metal translocating P-type ATPase [Planctomycetota bacterium]
MPRKTFRFPLRFPVDPARRALCARRIGEQLASRPGIAAVRVVETGSHPGPSHADVVELDYDPDLINLGQIEGLVGVAGGLLDESVARLVLQVSGLISPRQEHTVNAVLARLPGVHASASYGSQQVRVEFDRRACALPEIVRRLDHLGVRVLSHDQAAARASARVQTGVIREAMRQPHLILAVVGGLLLIAGLVVNWTHGPPLLRVALLTASYATSGWFTGIDVTKVLRRMRLDIDVLMFAAAFGAAALGHLEEGALLLFLFALGGGLEILALDHARRAIRALTRLAPETAIVIGDGGHEREVPVQDLHVGDAVRIHPGDRVPADGTVAQGHSAIDQSPITGESVPVEKSPGDGVFAGTLNGAGLLDVRVSRIASQSTVARVIRLVEEAQTTKSPTQVFTQRVERWYVPLVLAATVCVAVIPVVLGMEPGRAHTSHWMGWFYQAMAFLTAASPCALAIGTPAAVLSGIARGARSGVLIKGGAHLENLGRVGAIAFDKTGTLTYGEPEVTDIAVLEGAKDENEVLTLAAALERGSVHPLAKAISREAESRDLTLPATEHVTQTPGMGITGEVGGRPVAVGRLAMFNDATPGLDAARAAQSALEARGRTTAVVEADGRLIGVIALADRPREDAHDALAALHGLGVKHTVLLSGDNPSTARAVAEQVGVDDYKGGLLPEQKQRCIEELVERYGYVAMVGDGVNDAPAMARATVGIAVGGLSGAGSDVAMETADVALLAGDLQKLPEAVGISRFTRRLIMENLVIALGVIAILAPLAAMGYTSLGVAVVFHEGSTVLVVLNGLRALGWKSP